METTTQRGTICGVGNSTAHNAFEAGQFSAREAVRPFGTDLPQLFVVFASRHYDLARLCQGIDSVAPEVARIGCSTAGEITSHGPQEHGVVILALGGADMSIAIGCGTAVDQDLRAASAQAARCVDEIDEHEHTVLLLLSDGLAGDQQEVVRGAYQQVGATVSLVGGCAGDDLSMDHTVQIFRDQLLTQSVVAAAISSRRPLGIGVRHGWTQAGPLMTVTDARGVLIRALDYEPALDAYFDALNTPDHIRNCPDAFTAYAATRPIGLARRGRTEIRYVATADYERRTITCFAGVPQGALCSLMEGDSASVLTATTDAVTSAVEQLGDRPPAGLVIFDCIARKGVLGDNLGSEIQRIRDVANHTAVAGFYTYGEIARTCGSSGFHNQTMVVLAIG